MAKKTEVDVTALLLNHRAPKKKSSKKEHPEITLEPLRQCSKCHKDISEPVEHCSNCRTSTNISDLVHEAYLVHKDAETAFRTVEGTLLEQVRVKYEEHAEEGKFSKTFDVQGTDTPGVQVSFKDSFSDVPIEKKDLLRKKLGEKFDHFFEEKRKLSLKDAGDETIKFLMGKLGQEKFFELFNVEVSLTCRPEMDRKQFDLSPEVRMAIKQNKPSVKVRSEE